MKLLLFITLTLALTYAFRMKNSAQISNQATLMDEGYTEEGMYGFGSGNPEENNSWFANPFGSSNQNDNGPTNYGEAVNYEKDLINGMLTNKGVDQEDIDAGFDCTDDFDCGDDYTCFMNAIEYCFDDYLSDSEIEMFETIVNDHFATSTVDV